MQVKWFKGIKTEEDREKRKQLLLNCQEALDILMKICYNINVEEQKSSKADYDSASWSHRQAHLNGRREAFEEIITLCNINK